MSLKKTKNPKLSFKQIEYIAELKENYILILLVVMQMHHITDYACHLFF